MMVIDNLCFGCHKIVIYHNDILLPNKLHTRFTFPQLPIEQVTDIYVEAVEQFNDENYTSQAIYISNEMNVYSKDSGEVRIYGEAKEKREFAHIKSCYQNNEVHVQLHNAFCNYWHSQSFQILNYIFIERLLLNTNAMVLHSCFIEYQNQAILFTAPSGTGKTTQGELWKKYEGAHIVNSDRCLIQKYKGRFWACGYYLHGSAQECENRVLPIKAIVIVRQSSEYIH